MDEKTNELYHAVKPLYDWLKKHGNPHTTIVVESHQVRVVEDVIGVPIEVD